MKILQERVDREEYLELCITPREYELIKEYMIISKRCSVNGYITNIGIKLELLNDDE